MEHSEIWKPVPGYSWLYASSRGRIYDSERGCVRSQTMSHYGYWTVYDKKNMARVHRMVYSAFHPDEDITGLVIRHMDHTRDNNKIENLRSGTQSDNIWDMANAGRHFNSQKETCPRGHEFRQNTFNQRLRATGVECKACHRASATLSYRKRQGHKNLDLQSISDLKYENIMKEAELNEHSPSA